MSYLSQNAARVACARLASILLLLVLATPAAQAASRGVVRPNALPTLSVDDVAIAEGQSGAKEAVFTISLSAPAPADVAIQIATAQISAVGNDDFQHAYGSAVPIFAGQTSTTVKIVIFGDTVPEADESFQLIVEGATNATIADGIGVGTIVNDDAGASPSLLIADAWIPEGNSGSQLATFKVQLSQPAATDVSFSIASANGTASAGSDYTAISLANQVIPAGQLSKAVTVSITGDTGAEKDETFRLNLSNAVGAAIGRSQATATIGNDDGVSPVKISVGDVYVQEGSSGTRTATFYVNLSQPAASTVSFDLRTEDSSATAGSDYVALTLAGQTIAAGQTSKSFNVTVNGDTQDEPLERFLLVLSNVANAAIEYADPHGVATIPNDDATLSIGDVTQLEGSGGNGTAFLFPVSLSAPLDAPVLFQVETIDGTAVASSGDYNGQSFSNWQIPSGASQANVVIWVGSDSRMEPDETFTVRISGGGLAISDNVATGTILNDDAPPFPTLYVNNASVTEGNAGTKVMNFIITMSEDAFNPVSFDCHTSAGSAQAGVDYVEVASSQFTIPTGQTQGSFPVTINGDTAIEYDDTFYLSCGNPVGGTFAGGGGATGTILNDDFPVVPEVSIGDATVTETNADQQLLVPITLSAPPTNPVNFAVFATDASALYSSDYYPQYQNVQVPAGATSATVAIGIRGDTLGEEPETFELQIGAFTNAVPGDTKAVVTINDDDGVPAPNLSVDDVTVMEGAHDVRSARFVVSLSKPATVPVVFDVVTTDRTASSPLDFTAVPLSSRTIAVGETFKAIAVPVKGDPWYEDDETFEFGVYNLVGANPRRTVATGTIRNDDVPPGPRLSIADVRFAEGDSGLEFNYVQITLSEPATSDFSFDLASEDGSAQAGVDYEPMAAHFLMGAGQTSAIYAAPIHGDTDFEADETFQVRLSNPQGGGVAIADGVATVTIVNDDATSGPTLAIGDASVAEGNAGTQQLTFTVSLSQAAGAPVSFDVATSPGTATAGSDFVAASQVGMSIAAGQTSASFSVTINGDAEVEGNETFNVNLSKPVGATLLDGQARGTISNDDSATLSIEDATVVEGNEGTRTATFVVKLSHVLPSPVRFDVATSDGNATAGSDYVARSLAGRLMDAGRTRAVFEVVVNGDATPEPDEAFTAQLANVSGAVLGDASATGTIQDDDSANVTPIAQVQGSGAISPLLGQVLAIEGIVTAVTTDGFFLQSADAGQDADPASSEALFVASAAANVAVGDRVHARGQVEEAIAGEGSGGPTLTRLAAATVSTLERDVVLPRPVALVDAGRDAVPTRSQAALERWEGMRVQASTLAVTAASGGLVDQASGRVRPDGRFHAKVLGPGGVVQRLRIDSTGQRDAIAISVDAGDRVTGLRGVLRQADGLFELLPDRGAPVSIAAGARPAPVSAPSTAEVAIGSFDLRQLLDDRRDGGEVVMEPTAYALRLAKSANAICAFARSPAILGLQGVEHAQAMQDLAAAVNGRDGNILFPKACDGDARYVAVADRARPGSLGLLVSTAPVRPGVPRVEVQSVEARADRRRFAWRDGGSEALFESPPLLMRARLNGTSGEVLDLGLLLAQLRPAVTASENGAHGWPTRAEYRNARRAAQLRAIADVVQAQQRTNPRLPLVVMGDVDALRVTPALVDLTDSAAGNQRYSAVRDGEPVAVDRLLVSQALATPAFAPRIGHARINADFGEDNLADPEVPVRTSDHDPVLLFLRLH